MADPIEFNRRLANDDVQRCGNRTQLEDENGAAITHANPLEVNVAGGIADPLPVTLETAAGVATGTAANPLRTDPTGTTAQPVNQGAAGAAPWVVTDNWVPTLRADEAADDSDKVFAVAANQQEQILWIWVEYTSTATVGDRQLVVQLQDGGNDVVGEWRAGAVQAAGVARNYCFAPCNTDLTAFRDTDYLSVALPPTLILPAGYQIRVYDNNAVAAAADDMIVQMMVARRTV